MDRQVAGRYRMMTDGNLVDVDDPGYSPLHCSWFMLENHLWLHNPLYC